MMDSSSPHTHHRHVLSLSLIMALALLLSGQSTEEPPPPPNEPISIKLQQQWRAEDDTMLDEVDEQLATHARWIQEELWERGHAARIARGTRTLEMQREGFINGYSKTLRSKHLCGKAVDFKLHPHLYPDVEDPFWDVKDELARSQKLLVLNAPSFRDRPHVELDEDCDWDSVGLGPEGTWRTRTTRSASEAPSSTQTLTVRKNRETGLHEGSLLRHNRRHALKELRVRHIHSGARNSHEQALVEATFESEESKTFTVTYEVSSVTSEEHGYVRADWRFLKPLEQGATLYRTQK